MSDERTLPPSARRRAQALEQGSPPRSPALTGGLLLLAVAAYGLWSGADALLDAAAWLEQRLSEVDSAPGDVVSHLQSAFWAGLGLAGGVVFVACASAAAAEVLQVGLHVRRPQATSPWLSRWSRIADGLQPASLLGEVLRWAVPMAVLTWLLASRWGGVASLATASAADAAPQTGVLLTSLLLRLTTLLIVLGAVQWAWRRWTWERSLWMTPDEQREEQRLDGRRRVR